MAARPAEGAAASIASPRRVALTFDAEHPDRPTAQGVEVGLLDLLAAREIRATFFIQGRWAEAYPELARRVVSDGHLVGSHSHYHARLPLLTDDGIAADLATAEDAVREHAGVNPRPWFRCPFGTGMDDPRILAAIGAAGYRHVAWDVVADDWDPATTATDIEEAIVSGTLRHGDGAVVLLHAWPQRMLEALPGIVERLRGAEFTFATIDELPRLPEGGEIIDELAEAGLGAPKLGSSGA